MKENREKFKQFVIEQLKDYDEYGEASTEGYAEIITDEAVKLFCQPAVSNNEVAVAFGDWLRTQRADIFYGCPTTKKLFEMYKKATD